MLIAVFLYALGAVFLANRLAKIWGPGATMLAFLIMVAGVLVLAAA